MMYTDGDGKNINFVRPMILLAQARSDDYGILYLTNNLDMDYRVILGASEDLDLTGVKFFFAGKPTDR